jgi:very-short-patch-repair endonuclease
VPADRRPRRSEGLIIRETLPRQDLTIFAGVPVTSLARTVFDCVRLLPDDEALGLLDVALRREWISFGELCDRVRAHVGRPGARRLVSLVRQVGSGARSHAERLAVTLLRRSGIEGWTANAEIHDEGGLVGVGDLVFREERVVAEVDGWEFHSARDAFERDRARQNRLVAAGWTVLRFTWRDLVRDPDRVVNTIRSVLAARRRRRKA